MAETTDTTSSETAGNNNNRAAELRSLCQRIIESGCLGRSKVYSSLLEYLVNCSLENRLPKEIEIALDVMGRDSNFDVSKDSLVRVYVHNLRKKLHAYYTNLGSNEEYVITIPKGQYTIELQERGDLPTTTETKHRWTPQPDWMHGVLAIVVVVLLLAMSLSGDTSTSDSELFREYSQVRDHPLWRQIMADTRPIMVVVGDYYIFGEVEPETGNVTRMVREFAINSKEDLENYLMLYPDRADEVMDLELTYLPTSSAFALQDVLPILQSKGRRVSITTMSEMNTASLKTHHVIYLGYISGLEHLRELVFDGSRFAIGDTYDEIIDMDSKQRYFSGAGLPTTEKRFQDYGLLSTFPTPEGNQLMVIAGMRDAGLMHIAHSMADLSSLNRLFDEASNTASEPIAMEALFEVFGFDGMNFDAELITKDELDYNEIWGRSGMELSDKN